MSNWSNNKKWIAGIALAAVLLLGCVGTFALGAASMGMRGRQMAYMAPSQDGRGAQAVPGNRDSRGDDIPRNGSRGESRRGDNRRGSGGFLLGVVSGVFRLIFIAGLVGLIVLAVRYFVRRNPNWPGRAPAAATPAGSPPVASEPAPAPVVSDPPSAPSTPTALPAPAASTPDDAPPADENRPA
jgi:hypothetical protein